MVKIILGVWFMSLSLVSLAQSALEKVQSFRSAHEHAILNEYFDFLQYPNLATDQENILKNASFIEEMLQRRGVPTRRLHARTPHTPPAIYGEVLVPGASQTIIFYAHYDGQPVNTATWHPSLTPFKPQLLTAPIDRGGQIISLPAKGDKIDAEWRISCRSSADDKAGVMAIIAAYDAIRQSGLKPTWNIKFFFEGEEEIGSLHLNEILEEHQDLLTADLWLVADGPIHQSGLPLIDFGVRRDVNLDLTIYGPKRPLHSGHYGNWAPNPCLKMAKLLAGMKDDQGLVTIPGFYADAVPFTASERQAFLAAPSVDEQMKKELGIHTPEGGGRRLFEAYEWPSLNINGIDCADAGEKATNIIPTIAKATLDLRQVMGTDYKKQIELVKKYIADQGYHLLEHAPTDAERLQYPNLIQVSSGEGGYNAQRTPLDLPISKKVIAAVQSATSKSLIILPTAGGSLPLYLFEKILDAKVINLCVTNHDSNQHSDNENLRIQNLWDAIDQLAMVMLMK